MITQRGVGLIELMISLFLFCLLIAIATQFYLMSKRHYLTTEKDLTQAVDMQLVNQLIRDSIRAAGFTPCLNMNYLIMQDGREGTSALLKAIEIKENSLTIRRMSDDFFTVKRQFDSQHLLIPDTKDLAKGDIVLIADCVYGEIHELDSIEYTSSGLLIGLKKPLSFTYMAPMYIGSWLQEQFFIKTDKQNIKNLFYKINHAEQLTSVINHFSVKLLKKGKHQFIDVILGIEDKAMQLYTRVRLS
ncbi:PilW family protein [Legionella sp. D16C41]|uniref:PilW family protein n=1 Tax=Legionella sp. D16C41 TaxID=3402688 RepID=UPI003AF60D64